MKTMISIKRCAALLMLTSAMIYGGMVHAMQAPQEMLESVTQQILVKLKAEKTAIQTDSARLIQIVDEIIMPHVDIEETSKRILAKNWREMTPTQHQQFVKEFEIQLIRTYAAAFRSYDQQHIVFVGTRPNPQDPKRTEVRSLIKESGQADIPVNYRLLNNGQQWKVYDIIVDGISIVSSYRSQFNEAIARDGIDKVIQDMHEKNQQKF